MLSALGRREEAVAQAEDAVRIYRQLVQRRPDAFLPDLARALAVRGQIIAEDRPDEAMGAFEEAIRVLTPFFSQLPEAYAALMEAIRGLYAGAAQAGGVAPDATLLGP